MVWRVLALAMGKGMENYWVVGAMWGGDNDQYDVFIRRGYWCLGWDDSEQPAQAARRDQIQPGDRIAIKRMLGRGAPNIEIRALGVVTDVDHEDGRVYVRWVLPGLQRQVSGNGCFQSIHGPFESEDEWTRQAFCL
jgi:hypothetical protein